MNKRACFLDLISILIFVAIGRHAHKDGSSLGGMFSTTWPFAVGLMAGWLAIVLTHRTATTKSNGLFIVLCAVSLGMILRVISGQGTALTFIGVALVFLSIFLIGWRALFSSLSLFRSTKKSR